MYTPGDGDDDTGDTPGEEAAGDASREEWGAERRPFDLENDDGENDFGNDSMLSRRTGLTGRDSSGPEDGANGGGIPRRTGVPTAEAAALEEDDDAAHAVAGAAIIIAPVVPGLSGGSPLMSIDAERRLTLCAVLGGGGVVLAWTASPMNEGPDQDATASEGAASLIAVMRLCAQ
jgi:hypothetical protein